MNRNKNTSKATCRTSASGGIPRECGQGQHEGEKNRSGLPKSNRPAINVLSNNRRCSSRPVMPHPSLIQQNYVYASALLPDQCHPGQLETGAPRRARIRQRPTGKGMTGGSLLQPKAPGGGISSSAGELCAAGAGRATRSAATCGCGGSTARAASCSWFTPTTTTSPAACGPTGAGICGAEAWWSSSTSCSGSERKRGGSIVSTMTVNPFGAKPGRLCYLHGWTGYTGFFGVSFHRLALNDRPGSNKDSKTRFKAHGKPRTAIDH